jgi:uncharacterized membrane protein (DUF373 family)
MKKPIGLLENLDDIVQTALAFLLFIAASAVLIVATYHFAVDVTKNFSDAVINLVHEILMIMIALELMFTVLTYLKEHTIPLEPFFVVGILSSLRKILMVGAQMTMFETSGNINDQLFRRYLMELGIHTLIVFVLVISLLIIKKYREQRNS